MIGFLVLLFPFVLLAFVLFMERVEEPLSQVAVERELEEFFDKASPEDLDTFVREGTDRALSRYHRPPSRRWWRFGRRRGLPPPS